MIKNKLSESDMQEIREEAEKYSLQRLTCNGSGRCSECAKNDYTAGATKERETTIGILIWLRENGWLHHPYMSNEEMVSNYQKTKEQ